MNPTVLCSVVFRDLPVSLKDTGCVPPPPARDSVLLAGEVLGSIGIPDSWGPGCCRKQLGRGRGEWIDW